MTFLMSEPGLNSFGGYRKARELFDLVVKDTAGLASRTDTARLVSQQIASADSVCANVEEGYGRGSRKEYAQFLGYARGSAWETRGRYERLQHWLPEKTVQERIALCGEIIAILTRTILSLRNAPPNRRASDE